MNPDWATKPTAVPYAEFGDPQSLNLYSYVRNNPLNRIDVDGHCWPFCDIAVKVSVTIGAFTARHPEIGEAAGKMSHSLTGKVSLGVAAGLPLNTKSIQGSIGAAGYVKETPKGTSVGVEASGGIKIGSTTIGPQPKVDIPIIKDGELVNPIKNTKGSVGGVLEGENEVKEQKGSLGISADDEGAAVGGKVGEGVQVGVEVGTTAEALQELGEAIFNGIVSDIKDEFNAAKSSSNLSTRPQDLKVRSRTKMCLSFWGQAALATRTITYRRPMTFGGAIIEIVFGVAFLVSAVTKQRFYWRRMGASLGKEIKPRWVGRLLFGCTGTLFILVGIRYFLLGY